MAGTSKDLLKLERKNSSSSALESALLVCKSKSSSSLSGPPLQDGRPIAPLAKSQVLGKVKDFLGIMAEANKRLEQEAKDNAEAYDIEALTGNESEIIEMDLMLGVADLHTPEAVSAAEAAIAGNQCVIPVAGETSDTESEESSDDSDESESDEENKAGAVSSRMETSKTGKDSSSGESAGKGNARKRPKIVELS